MSSRLQQAKPAVRTGKKARIALAGPSGSGKTWSALSMARTLAPEGTILVIDTERGSAALYSDRWQYEELDWQPPYDPRDLTETLGDASGKYDVVIVDSLTHFWDSEGGTLELVDTAAARGGGGGGRGNFTGWKVGTPAQNRMVEAMLAIDAHLIATMRVHTEWVMEPNRDGKMVPRKVGMAPMQRKGIEHEFTVTADLDLDHQMVVSKTRCDLLDGKVYRARQEAEMAATLRDWLAGAAEAPPRPAAPPPVASSNGRSDARPTTDAPLIAQIATTLHGHPDKGRLFGQHQAKIGRGDLAGISRWVNGLSDGEIVALAIELGVNATETHSAPEPEAPPSAPSQNGTPAPQPPDRETREADYRDLLLTSEAEK